MNIEELAAAFRGFAAEVGELDAKRQGLIGEIEKLKADVAGFDAARVKAKRDADAAAAALAEAQASCKRETAEVKAETDAAVAKARADAVAAIEAERRNLDAAKASTGAEIERLKAEHTKLTKKIKNVRDEIAGIAQRAIA